MVGRRLPGEVDLGSSLDCSCSTEQHEARPACLAFQTSTTQALLVAEERFNGQLPPPKENSASMQGVVQSFSHYFTQQFTYEHPRAFSLILPESLKCFLKVN